MSEAEGGLVASSSLGPGSSTPEKDPDPEPDRPNPAVEERDGKTDCTLFYWYPAEADDQVSWAVDPYEGYLLITFSVKRLVSGVERVVCYHESRPIPDEEDAQLERKEKEKKDKEKKKDKGLKVKKGYYKVKLSKRAEFSLTPFFRTPSPQ